MMVARLLHERRARHRAKAPYVCHLLKTPSGCRGQRGLLGPQEREGQEGTAALGQLARVGPSGQRWKSFGGARAGAGERWS